MDMIFFDTETNGFKGSSVLSISAIKVNYDKKTDKFTKKGDFHRFYFRNPGEEINQEAIKINGLTDEVITEERKKTGNNYPMTFKEDMTNFYIFCQGVDHYIAHNIKFDRDFIDFPLKNQFDTMLENIEVLKLPGKFEGSYKWPKLMECIEHYKIPYEENNLHGSYYDVLMTFRLFYKMSKKPETKEKIYDFMKGRSDSQSKIKGR